MHARIFGILMENHKDFYSKIDFTSHNISKRDFYGLLKFAIFFSFAAISSVSTSTLINP